MTHRSFRRVLAGVLCFALLLPNFTGLVTAADSVSAQSVQTNTKWVPVSDPFASGEIPAYLTVSGTVSAEALEYDCGNGLTNDGAKSYMKLVTNTKASEFLVFVNALTDAGFTRTSYRTMLADESGMNNLFYHFLSPQKNYALTAYYIEPYHEVRIIADTAEDMAKSFAGGFVYESTTNEVAQTMVTMYGLSMSPNGYDITSKTAYTTGARNCGALIVIRMPDNSLFINDGGDIEQWSDEVCADFMKFCRELTGKSEGEKVVINTWFVSHAHTDHFDGIPRFFDQYHEHIDIKNVMYNIDDERLGTTRDMSAVMGMINGYFPDAKYYKPHTGDSFNIAGVKFDVLYAQEDRFVHNSERKMVIDIRDGDETNSNENRDGTYRDFLYEDSSVENLSDFNDTSTVLKVTFPKTITGGDEVTSILYGDVNLADQVLIDMWPDSTLETDIMMVPHHGHDAHPELVALSNASIFMYTQAKSAIYGPNGIVDEDVDLAGTYRPALVQNFLEMGGETYFGTTDARKTYWEGTETACILFGENTAFDNMPTGLTRDNMDPAGYTVYTMDAPFFEYGGWKSVETVRATGETESATGVAIGTKRIRFDLVKQSDGLSNEGRYLIVHDQTDSVLMYNAIATYAKQTTANLGYSMYVGSGKEASAGTAQAYYKVDDSAYPEVKNKNSIYFARHLRDAALWITSQTDVSGKGTAFTESADAARFDGVHYKFVSMIKGLSTDDDYWYCVSGNDYAGKGIGNQWRNLRPNKDPVFSNESGDNMRIELLDDDTCVIFYIGTTDADTDDEKNVDKKVLRFLTVDKEGHWCRKEYYVDDSAKWADVVALAKADIASLKLRLYSYTTRGNDTTDKAVAYNGLTNYEVIKGTSKSDIIAVIKQNFHVIDSSVRNQDIPCSGTTAKVGYYWVDMSSYDGSNDCTVTVNYRNDDGTDSPITTLSIDMQDYFEMYCAYNDDDTVHAGTRYGSKYGFLYQGTNTIYEEVVNCANLMDLTVTVRHYQTGVTTSIVNVTPDMLIDPDTGKAVDTSVLGEHAGLKLVYDGQVIGENFILNVAASEEALSNPAYPNPGSVITKKQGTTAVQDFLNTGVANIQLSATGMPLKRGVDLIIMMDLSGSMNNALDTNDHPVEGQVSRVEAMEESLKTIISELQESDTDVRVAMADFGDHDHFTFKDSVVVESKFEKPYYDINLDEENSAGIEFYNHLNWVLSEPDTSDGIYEGSPTKFNPAHSQYTGYLTPEIYTGQHSLNANAFVDVDSLTQPVMDSIIERLNVNVKKSIGTNYDIGLEYVYRLGYAIRQDNIAKGQDRDVVCIFLSDGAAIQYNYFMGRSSSTSYADMLMGIPDEITSVADYYANQENWPTEIEQISEVFLDKLITEQTTVASDKYYGTFSSLLAPDYRNLSEKQYFIYEPSETRANARYFYTYMDDQEYDLYSWEYLYDIAIANGLEEVIGQEFTQEYYHETDNVLQYLIDLLTTPGGKITYEKDENGNYIPERDANGNIIYETDENGELVTDENGEYVPVYVIKSFESKLQNPYYRDLGRYDPENPEHEDEILVAAYRYYKLPTWEKLDPQVMSYTDQFFAAMKSIGVDCDWNLYARLAEVNRDALGIVTNTPNAPRTIIRNLITKMKTPVEGYGDYQTLSPYDYFYNAEGKNWWAEAIKGETNKLYPVINKYAFENNAAWGSDAYYGAVRNNFTTGTGLKLDGQDYISGFQGLGMDLYTVSFAMCADNKLTVEVAENILRNVSSGSSYFYTANSEDELTNALQVILSSMSTAATRGWYTDTMGPDFNLSTEKTVVSHDGQVITVNTAPSIKVMEYDLVQVTDANGNVTYERNGVPRVIEVVTFEDLDKDGDTDAWSNLIYTTEIVNGEVKRFYTDIWDEKTGLISASNFYYNANLDDAVTIAFGKEGNYSLDPETFFWSVGVIGQAEIVLEYQAYLTGSIEGERFLTSSDYYHATNENAVLHYTNYLGQNSTLGTVSPEYPWGDARVGVGFYLVNENGQIICDQTTGETTTDFSKAIKLTRPAYEYLLWNDEDTEASAAVTAADHRPDGYSLYSPSAAYGVNLTFNGSGSWTITDEKASTYVEAHDGNYSTSQSFAENSYTTGETIVWFAVVVITPTTAPDTVVVDYGLPVDINVLGNDVMFGTKGTLAALGSHTEDIAFSGENLNTNIYSANPYQGTYGTATIENGKVHYELTSTEMNGSEKFNYAVYYTPGAGEDTAYKGYHYNTVTVIPATSIYYEDSFADYDTYVYSGNQYVLSDEDRWTDVQDENYEQLKDAHQDEDRPGTITLPEFDADNLYGYDSAYESCSKYSLGSAKKFTADDTYSGAVSFSFYGTGFDVVSLTSSDTGTIIVDVYNAEGYVQDQSTPIRSLIVDTYYGYTYDKENDEWVITPEGDSLYQVPVMKVSGLNYGHYTAVITIAYASFFDHNTEDASYDFYMDAVRIYDPAGNDGSNDDTAGDAYVEDGEYAPVYEELRNILISEREFYDSTANLGNSYFHGAVFIDGIPTLNGDNYDTSFSKDPPEIGTYLNYGPNNEVYLAPGQAIAFELNGIEGLKAAHLAFKSTGGTAKVKIFRASSNIADISRMDVTTATDRYYDLTALVGDTVIIVNVGSTAADSTDGILSITNVKLTADPTAPQVLSFRNAITISESGAQRALKALTVGAKNEGQTPGDNVPGTGDSQEALMFSLMLLASLCMMAIIVLVYMDKRLTRARKR